MKGLKHITALAGTAEPAATAAPAPAPAPAVAVEKPPPRPADPTTAVAASPTTVMVAQQSVGGGDQEGSTGKGQTAQVPEEESDSVQGEKETAAEEQEQEEAATMNEPLQDVNNKPKAGGELLLELIRSFRGGMLRVDSNLRAAMFRSLRYLVRTWRVLPVAKDVCSLLFSRDRNIN